MSAGMCSNPEPSKQISELPLGHIDFAWYILAQIEASSSFPPEIRDRLPERTRGTLPAMEFDLRLRTMQAAIAALDVSALADHCLEFAAVRVYVESAGGLRRFSADPLNPEVHELPPIDATSSHPALADIVVHQGMVAFAVQSLLQKDRVPGPPLADGMEAYLGHGHPAIALFRKARQLSAAGNDIYDELAALLPISADLTHRPLTYCGLPVLGCCTGANRRFTARSPFHIFPAGCASVGGGRCKRNAQVCVRLGTPSRR